MIVNNAGPTIRKKPAMAMSLPGVLTGDSGSISDRE